MPQQINEPATQQGKRRVTKNVGGFAIEYRTEDAKLSSVSGPALSQKDYHEWWSNGDLVATYDKGVLKKTDNGRPSGLVEAQIPAKWTTLISTLSLEDLELCKVKDSALSSKIANMRQPVEKETQKLGM